MILGLDVSHWNVPNWADWAARGYKFAWIKCTEATGFTDPKFVAHYAAASAFKRGPYHFFRNAANPEDQAAYFRATVGDRMGELPPMVDFEDTAAAKLGETPARALRCLKEVERLFGRKPVIYSAAWWWNPWIGNVAWANDYPLWVANYTTAASPVRPIGWDHWDVWQYTSSPLDQNRMSDLIWTALFPPGPPPDTVTITIQNTTAFDLKAALS